MNPGGCLIPSISTSEQNLAAGSSDFHIGVVEGFYGPPWSAVERAVLFARMAAWGMNTYLYAPKDDLKHRAIWRESYLPEEAEVLRCLIGDAHGHGLRFIYALAPGLDIRFSDRMEFDRLVRRVEQMIGLGCSNFALLFDDIPDRMHAEDSARFGSFAEAQCDLTNRLFEWVRGRTPHARFLFCPTPYCGRMAERELGGRGYLATAGRLLAGDIQVFWTGPDIISREISVAHLREVASVLRRKPLLWDNLHANDYDGRRFFCGPYSGRAPEIRSEVSGIMTNPNTEFPLNYVALRTCAEFARSEGGWNPREAYLRAVRDWAAQFATVGQPIPFEDVVLLGDAFYLPHKDGPEAQALFAAIQELMGSNPTTWRTKTLDTFRECATRLRDCCARVAELRDRPLFYALSRRVWELREELDLLLGAVQLMAKQGQAQQPIHSDFHLPGTYRGSFVARLQQLLEQQSDGALAPTARPVESTTLRPA